LKRRIAIVVDGRGEARPLDYETPLGWEAQMGPPVLVGPDPDGQGGSLDVVMGDKVCIVSTNQVGNLIRYRIGSHDDRVVVLVDGEAVETQSQDLAPWDGY
jgi:hypothetical protein